MKKVTFESTAESFQEMIDHLPDERPDDDRPCKCGECDGYGHVIDSDGKARFCPNFFEQKVGPTLDTLRRSEKFVETPTFLAVELLKMDVLTEGKPRAVFLSGSHGRSKTEASRALLNEAALNGVRGHYVSFPELIKARKTGYDGNAVIQSHLRAIQKSRIVVIDEIGRESQHGNEDHPRSMLTEIIQYCDRQRFAIFITNLSIKEIDLYLDTYAKSRLHGDSGYCSWVEDFEGADLRFEGFE